ncbi:putative non-specific serine/threonine protein kinase [Helianthus annuus]|nr:putative non-specific serine/threonine protein kinase [Helianthus annuus]
MHPYSNSSANFSSPSIVSLGLGNNNLNSSMFHWLFPLTTNRLVILDLSGNKLHGIPKYFGNLCGLKELHLENNSVTIKFSDLLNNISGCTSVTLEELNALRSQFTGSLPDDIQRFSSLGFLQLSKNKLNGTISEKVWLLPNLEILDVSSNSLRGVISENIGKTKSLTIDLSDNMFKGVPSEAHMSNLSSVESINLSSCKLGPRFPKWIQALRNLIYLDIANTRISDTIPVEFWNMWPSQLEILNISSNDITGEVTDLSSNFNRGLITTIDLSSNNFYGVISDVFSSLSWLDLSKNKFYGGISFLCQIVDGTLSFLDLSHNSFTGKIPDCLWHFKELRVLNLAKNNLYGSLPASIEYLINIEALYLFNNNFSGELPLSLKNCTALSFLELGSNKFSGYVPAWIGGKLSNLYALILSSNNFFGTIPLRWNHSLMSK